MSEPTPTETPSTPEAEPAGPVAVPSAEPMGRWARMRAHPGFAIFIALFAIWVGWNVSWLVGMLWAAVAEMDRDEAVPFSILTLSAQGTTVAIVWLASGRLPRERAAALALRRSPLSMRHLVYVAIASVGLHNLWGYIALVLGTWGGASEGVPSAQMLYDVSASTTDPFSWMVLIITSALVAAFEEIHFRGYLMRRLAMRWSVPTSVGISAFIFAMAHLHPTHAIAVLPIGAWLGYLAWKTNSTMTSIVGHAAILLYADAQHLLMQALNVQAEEYPPSIWLLWGMSILFGVWAAIRLVKVLEAGPKDRPWEKAVRRDE